MRWGVLINVIASVIETAIEHWPRKKKKGKHSRGVRPSATDLDEDAHPTEDAAFDESG